MKLIITLFFTAIAFVTFGQDQPIHPSQQRQQQEQEEQQPQMQEQPSQTQEQPVQTQQQPQQEDSKVPLSEKIFFGGSFGMGFGTYSYVNLSPLVGYKLTPRFSLAGGVIYQYSKWKNANFSSNMYGARALGIAKVYGPIFAQLEYEYLNYDSYSYYSNEDSRRGYNSVFGGGGIAQPISNNVYFSAVALYNFTYGNGSSYYSVPYDSPWVFRVGVTAGF